MEVGKALTAWEGVQAAVAEVFVAFGAALVDQIEFSEVKLVHARAARLKIVGEQTFHVTGEPTQIEATRLSKDLKKLLGRYRGWAERCNDIAHGYVTEAAGQNYEDPEQPLATNYALCPSHARLYDWNVTTDHRTDEPIFNYIAADIRRFVSAFQKLDQDLTVFAQKTAAFRAKAKLSC